MTQSKTLYLAVVKVTTNYLGPASDRFIDRQIRSHLKKSPEQLHKADLRELIDWIELAMSVLTDDSKLVSEYIARLKTLAKNGKNHTLNGAGVSRPR